MLTKFAGMHLKKNKPLSFFKVLICFELSFYKNKNKKKQNLIKNLKMYSVTIIAAN